MDDIYKAAVSACPGLGCWGGAGRGRGVGSGQRGLRDAGGRLGWSRVLSSE